MFRILFYSVLFVKPQLQRHHQQRQTHKPSPPFLGPGQPNFSGVLFPMAFESELLFPGSSQGPSSLLVHPWTAKSLVPLF